MTETIKAEVDEALAKRFRKKAMERFGYKKGAVKSALEDALRRYVSAGEIDWKPLRGTLASDLDSVTLQHSTWKGVD
ncbi:MAG: hypothetical protein HY296_02735 [Thaumarchaeota archaeon]|nr:hypothetical protein [Nitrososphaerota archaeon]